MNTEQIQKGLNNLTAEKKERRGRHPKGCDCGRCVWSKKPVEPVEPVEPKPVEPAEPKQVDTTPVEPIGDGLSELDKAIFEYNEQPEIKETASDESTPATEHIPPPPENNAIHISGTVLLGVIDLFFPVVMVKIWSFFNPKASKIDTSKMKMTADEKSELKELADMVAAEYVKLSPLTMFTISIGVIYYTKANEQL